MKGADRGARPLMILLKRTCSGQLRVFAGAAPLALPHCFSLTAGGSTPRCCWRRPVEYACSHPTARAKSAAAGRCRMPLRASTVSFKSPTGITHGVDVEAETVYEAAGVSLARLKKDGWIEGLARARGWRSWCASRRRFTALRFSNSIAGSMAPPRAQPKSCVGPASSSYSGSKRQRDAPHVLKRLGACIA